jgi:hypothetical protein
MGVYQLPLRLPEEAEAYIEAALADVERLLACPKHPGTTLDIDECDLCVLEDENVAEWVRRAMASQLPIKEYR